MPEDQIPKSMNYRSYETKIVDQCGVVLVGYPGDKGIINPGELDALMLKELITRLNDGRCHWEKLSQSELMQRRRSMSQTQSPASSGASTSQTPSSSATGASMSQTHSPNSNDASPSQERSPTSSDELPSAWFPGMGETGSDGEDSATVGRDEEKTMMGSHSQPESMGYPSLDSGLWQSTDPVARAMQILLGNYRAWAGAVTSSLPNHTLPFSPEARSNFQTAPLLDGTSSNLLSMFLSQPNCHQSPFRNPSEAYSNNPSPQESSVASSPQSLSSSASFSRDGSNNTVFGNMEVDGSDFWPYIGEDLS